MALAFLAEVENISPFPSFNSAIVSSTTNLNFFVPYAQIPSGNDTVVKAVEIIWDAGAGTWALRNCADLTGCGSVTDTDNVGSTTQRPELVFLAYPAQASNVPEPATLTLMMLGMLGLLGLGVSKARGVL